MKRWWAYLLVAALAAGGAWAAGAFKVGGTNGALLGAGVGALIGELLTHHAL